MRLCVVTANLGGIDTPKQHAVSCPVHYYTENNLPFPLPHLSDRLRGKYLKIMMHRYLPGYDGYIWLDGSVTLLNDIFVQHVQDQLAVTKMVLLRHPSRTNIAEEFDYIAKRLPDTPYLSTRYKDDPFDEERAYYKSRRMPDNAPLYAGYMFARLCDKRMNAMCNDWWNMVLEHTQLDQTQLAYVVWKYKLTPSVLEHASVFPAMAVRQKHEILK